MGNDTMGLSLSYGLNTFPMLDSKHRINRKAIADNPEATMPFIRRLSEKYGFDILEEWQIFMGKESTIARRKAREENNNIDKIFDGYLDEIKAKLDVSKYELLSKSRKGDLPIIRHALVYICDKNNIATPKKISQLMKRDRTTCIHSIQTVNDLLDSNDKRFGHIYNALKYLIEE